MLAALSPRDARAAALPARRARPSRRCARSPPSTGCPVAAKPDSQDLCFLAGTGRAAFLARHGGLGERPGDIVDARGARRSGRHRGAHHFTVGQRRGLGVGGAAEPLYVLAHRRGAPTRVTVGPRAALATTRRARPRRAPAPRRRARSTRVKLRYRAPAVPCTLRRRHRSSSHEPVDGAAPGQTACFLRGDVVAGMRHNRSRDLRRDPRALPVASSRSATTSACPSASLVPGRATTRRSLLTTAGMHPLKPYFLGQREAAAPPADDAARSASARPTSTTSAPPRAT